MKRLLSNNTVYLQHNYLTENEFEKAVITNYKQIFGANTIYIDIKKRIGDSILSIPDGYLIDFSFEADPRLYIIENELSNHDPYKHIGTQILKFAIGYKATGRNIKKFLLDHILADESKLSFINQRLQKAGSRNIDALLESLIFDKPVAAIVIIDQSSPELENVLGQLTMKTDIIEFGTFSNNGNFIHQFTPFNAEIRDVEEHPQQSINIEQLDTIVVPAQAEGFQRAFVEKKAWWQIRISASMLERIKFIAVYQVAPISAITHYAEVGKIEKYKDTNKYILYFKDVAKEINPPIKLDSNIKGLAPQAPRYTSFAKLQHATKLSEVF